MDMMSVIGLITVAGVVMYGMATGETVNREFLWNFWNPVSVYIVLGGTFGALMLTSPLNVMASVPRLLLKVFFPKRFTPQRYIDIIVDLATEARRRSVLALEDRADEFKDEFIKKGITLAVDAVPPEDIRDVLETDLACMMERHGSCIALLERGAALAPGFGMIGTLAALVNMFAAMQNSADNGNITGNLIAAMITAFYGSVLANVLFIPMAGKLRRRSGEEVLCKQILTEGIISISNGENPNFIRERLMSFVPPKMRAKTKSGRDAAT